MRRRIRGARPSPATLVAVVALIAALAGTAIADPGATTSAINKKKVKKIATKQINKLAPGLSVAHAATAVSADTADTAGSADSADTASTASTAKSAQSALSANTADSVGGVSIEPVRIAVPEGAPETPVVSVDGSFVSVSNCGGGEVSLRAGRAFGGGSSPPIAVEFTAQGGAGTTLIANGNATSSNDPVLGLSASIRESTGRVTRVFIDGFYETNAFGGSDDCFVQGTIERFG